MKKQRYSYMFILKCTYVFISIYVYITNKVVYICVFILDNEIEISKREKEELTKKIKQR